MKIDLKIMSRKELEKLNADVNKALDRHRKKDLQKVRAEIEKLAAAHGVSVADVLGGAVKGSKAPKAKSPPKFANPADPSQTWTGKGRQPDWYKSAVAAGSDPESMMI